MSTDLRRGVAYFGPREKMYSSVEESDFPSLPLNWRRVLSTCHPFPVVGPMGCVYKDIDHAMAGFRVHYTTSNPCLAFLFRHENARFASASACREWSTSNSLSLLLSSPDDRVWFVLRDRCMFDLVFQRICRDEEYRKVLRYLIEQRFLPVYHVRTAYAHTYWGGIIDKTKLTLTSVTADQHRNSSVDSLAEISVDSSSLDPSRIIVGKNRLGFIMKSAMETYIQVYHTKMALRANVFSVHSKADIREVKDESSDGSESEFDFVQEEDEKEPEEQVDDGICYLPAYDLTPLGASWDVVFPPKRKRRRKPKSSVVPKVKPTSRSVSKLKKLDTEIRELIDDVITPPCTPPQKRPRTDSHLPLSPHGGIIF